MQQLKDNGEHGPRMTEMLLLKIKARHNLEI